MEGSCLVIGNCSLEEETLKGVFSKQDLQLKILHLTELSGEIRIKSSIQEAIKRIPDLRVIILSGDRDHQEILKTIEGLRENDIDIPIIVLRSLMDKELQAELLKKGVYMWQKDERQMESLPLVVQCVITKYELEKEMIRKKEMIAESRREWVAIFDGITDFIFVTDEALNIVKINRSLASYFKKTPKEVIGEKCYNLFGCNLEECKVRTISSSQMDWTYEKQLSERVYQVTLYPCVDRRPLIIHYMKDITEVVRLKKQLYHAEKLTSLGLLVSGVAHEINNPLTGVIAYTELLLLKTDEGPLKNELRKILHSAERCKKVVENLLTFARQREPLRSLESVNEIIDRAIELRAYWLRTNNIEIVRDYGDIPSLFLDSQQMQQVFLNIILNAEQAIQDAGVKNGRIKFTTRYLQEEDKVIVRISDNGPGIPEENLSRIFDPFFTTKPVGIGTGLGLSISHGIVSEHGGSIWAENSPEGGAIINIELPARDSNYSLQKQRGGAY